MSDQNPSDPPRVFARRFASVGARVAEVVELRFEQRERSRLRATLRSGEDIGIDLPIGTLLVHGSRLQLEDGRVVAIEAAEEDLLRITASGPAALLRIAYHIGNRHVPVEIDGDALYILPDHVLQTMVERLGARVEPVSRGFQPESGAYGHSHVHHHHDDEGHGGRIHSMTHRHD